MIHGQLHILILPSIKKKRKEKKKKTTALAEEIFLFDQKELVRKKEK